MPCELGAGAKPWERQVVLRIPELPSFPGLWHCQRWRSLLGVSPRSRRAAGSPSWALVFGHSQPFCAKWDRCPWGAGEGIGVSSGCRTWLWVRIRAVVGVHM